LGSIPEKDLPALYSGATAFVFPSIYEGFGLPPVEAMACGVPVACSGIPCLSETVGGAALLFDPEHPENVAAAVERILSDEKLRADLRVRGLRRAAELSWDEAARQALKIYHRM
jgi:alpha-1,3-rhamnosyl/mannosyltransferase